MSGSVLVALSGGVDSAVAAYLLKSTGFEVLAATIRLVPGMEEALEPPRRIAKHLAIEHHVVDLTEVFEREIVSYFLDEYSRGRTPNPCIRCNPSIKFSHLYKFAVDIGCTQVATGHYARVERNDSGHYLLKRGLDPAKDQSYFLSGLNQEQLSRALFPVGEKAKEKVRRIAGEIGVSEFVTPESQDICFLKHDTSCQAFIKERLSGKLTPGPVLDTAGNKLGTHDGIQLYTTGQRRGLGIAGGKPLYVVRVIPQENAVILGERSEAMCKRFTAVNPNWVSWRQPPAEFNATVKIRYLHPGAEAHVTVKQNVLDVEFEEPQFAVTPGQSAVLYQGDLVIANAIINTRC